MFGELIREARTTKKYTLRDLSGIVGLSIGFLSELERGKCNPPSNNNKFSCLCLSLGLCDVRMKKVADSEEKINMKLTKEEVTIINKLRQLV